MFNSALLNSILLTRPSLTRYSLTRFSLKNIAVTMKTLSAYRRKQQGLFIISSVLVLLSIAAFTLTSVTVAVSDFQAVQEALGVTQERYLDTKKEMRNISSQLRTQPHNTVALGNTSIAHTIVSSVYHGSEAQTVKAFDIRLHHAKSNTKVKQRFLRYPSLIKIPTTLQATTPDTHLTQWLFNRSASALVPTYFPLSVVASSCTDLDEATMHWINGDCELNKNDVEHSSSVNPMLLIIKNGHLTVLGGTSFYGVIILLSDDGIVYSATVKHGASINGALTSSHTITVQNDGALTYSPHVLRTLQQAPKLAKIIAVPGSWHAQF
jgi:hypothetical protein